jgi:hypothetical protein
VAHGVTRRHRGNVWSRICVGTFWGRTYWALSIHEKAAHLALERNGEDGRVAAVEEALEFAISPSVKSCICIRGLWLEVAGRDGDAQGTGERSNAILRLTAPYHLSQAANVS